MSSVLLTRSCNRLREAFQLTVNHGVRIINTDVDIRRTPNMTTKTLEQKIAQIEAEEKIRRLIFEYAFHLDMNHPKVVLPMKRRWMASVPTSREPAITFQISASTSPPRLKRLSVRFFMRGIAMRARGPIRIFMVSTMMSLFSKTANGFSSAVNCAPRARGIFTSRKHCQSVVLECRTKPSRPTGPFGLNTARR